MKYFLYIIITCLSIQKEINSTCECNILNECINNNCRHKNFFPPTFLEIIGCFTIFLGSAFSNAGGIGGGGLLIPILILILKFETHEAIPLSKIMIFSGALTAFLMGLNKKHPYRKVIAIDYNIAGVMIPMILLGTMVGVSLNKFLPGPLILFALTLVLVINTYKTTKKGISQFHKENQETIEKITEIVNFTNENHSINDDGNDDNEDDEENMRLTKSKNEEDKEPDVIYKLSLEFNKDAELFPRDKYGYILLSFFGLVFITLIKGSDNTPSVIRIANCSYQYWIIYLCFVPFCIFVTFQISKVVNKEYNYRLSINYPYHSTDIQWSNHILHLYPLYGLAGGILAGVLGIGGGLVLGPLLLDLGIHPIVSTATSNFLVLFTSSSTTLQFIFHGMLNINYGIVCVLCSTIGSYFGTIVIQSLLKSSGRSSYLIFTLAAVLGISTVLIPSYTFYQIFHQTQSNNVWHFGSLC